MFPDVSIDLQGSKLMWEFGFAAFAYPFGHHVPVHRQMTAVEALFRPQLRSALTRPSRGSVALHQKLALC
jgi:hypothetical protein